MRLRWLAIAVGAALACIGCGKSATVSLTTGGSQFKFSPDEKILFAYGAPFLSAWDIAGRQVAWQKTLFAPDAWVTLSGGGQYVGVVTENLGRAIPRFMLLRAADGAKVSEFELGSAWQSTYNRDETTLVAVSADASWAAISLTNGVDNDSLCLAPLPSGKCVWFSDPDNAVDKLVFDPRELRLAVGWRVLPHWLDVYDHTGETWKREQRWVDAACPAWTSRGLAFIRPDGVHLYQGGKDVVAVRGALMGEAREECKWFTVSPDGAWLLSWAGWELKVTSMITGATVLGYQWEKKDTPGICTTGFSGNRLRAFTCTGLLFEFDLAKASVVKSTDFGSPETGDEGDWSFHEGGSLVALYRPLLSPSGDWLAIWRMKGASTLTKL